MGDRYRFFVTRTNVLSPYSVPRRDGAPTAESERRTADHTPRCLFDRRQRHGIHSGSSTLPGLTQCGLAGAGARDAETTRESTRDSSSTCVRWKPGRRGRRGRRPRQWRRRRPKTTNLANGFAGCTPELYDCIVTSSDVSRASSCRCRRMRDQGAPTAHLRTRWRSGRARTECARSTRSQAWEERARGRRHVLEMQSAECCMPQVI